jgi:hypothetical protein
MAACGLEARPGRLKRTARTRKQETVVAADDLSGYLHTVSCSRAPGLPLAAATCAVASPGASGRRVVEAPRLLHRRDQPVWSRPARKSLRISYGFLRADRATRSRLSSRACENRKQKVNSVMAVDFSSRPVACTRTGSPGKQVESLIDGNGIGSAVEVPIQSAPRRDRISPRVYESRPRTNLTRRNGSISCVDRAKPCSGTLLTNPFHEFTLTPLRTYGNPN